MKRPSRWQREMMMSAWLVLAILIGRGANGLEYAGGISRQAVQPGE